MFADTAGETDQQLAAGAPLTLEVAWTDQHGEPAAPAGTLTVGVTDAAGTVILPAGTATAADTGELGRYTVTVTAALAGNRPALLAATWTDGTSSRATTAELVGGFLFSVQQARAADPEQLREDRYSAAAIRSARQAVAGEFHQITGLHFTPTYRRVHLAGTGTGTLTIPDREISELRSVRVWSSATAYTEFTTAELAAVDLGGPTGILTRRDGLTWSTSRAGLTLEYVAGLTAVPPAIRSAAIRRARQVLGETRSAVPYNAISYSPDNGLTYRLSTPNLNRTGDPAVDAVLERYTVRGRPFA